MDTETSTPEATNFSLLAKEAFGNDFYGEVKEPGPAEAEPNPESEPEPESEAVEQEATEELENGTEEVSQETPEDTGEDTISTLSELIEVEGYDQEAIMGLQVEQKVNGETRLVKLADLVATDQTLEAATQRLEEAKEKANTQNQALAQKQEKVDQSFNVAAKLIERVEDILNRDMKAVDSELRKADPAEWAAQQAEFEKRKEEIQLLKEQTVSDYQIAHELTEEDKAALIEKATQEKAALLNKLPEWSDEKAMQEGQQKIANYLRSNGFTEQDAFIAGDHRLIVLAEKARLWDESLSKANPAKKKLKTLPKMLKPGASRSPDQINSALEQELEDKLRKTGDIKHAIALKKLRRGNS